MTALEDRHAALEAELSAEPVLLHPGLADRNREEAAGLTAALRREGGNPEAASRVRRMVSEIRLTSEGGELSVELAGELAGLLALSEARKQTPRAGASGRSIVMVGGVRCLGFAAFGSDQTFAGSASLRRSFPKPAFGGIVQHVLARQGQLCGTKLTLEAQCLKVCFRTVYPVGRFALPAKTIECSDG